MDTAHLRVMDQHSCMASALNLYFETRLFDTGEEFFERPWAIILSYKKKHIGAHDIMLLGLVQKGQHIYKRVNDYVHNSVSLNKWPIKTKTRRERVIIDYYSTQCMEGHVETAEFKDGQWRYLFYPEAANLPYTSMNLDEYREAVTRKETNLYLNIFHYVQT